MTYHWNFEIWLIGIFGGAILIGLFGWYGTRDVIKQSPLVVLREI